MHTKRLSNNLFQVDLQTGGYPNLISAYILKAKQAIIIETGPTSSIPNLLTGLKEINVKPETVAYIALSHVHADHSGGTGTILKTLPNARVIVHPKGAPHLIDPQKLWEQSQLVLGRVAEVFGKPEPVPKERVIAASDGMEIDAGENVKLRVIETLGHASHHLSFYEPMQMVVFPGDAAGIYLDQYGTVVPTSPPPFRLKPALESIEKLVSLKPKTLCYSHFGEACCAEERLRDYAVQLNLWMNIAKDGVSKNQSQAVIAERILTEDERTRGIMDFLKSHPIYSKTVVGNSVQGFVEAAAKPQP
jgi:glyoxylase-like metal-dependent hydrolase (beta-lactamase superfamily II)